MSEELFREILSVEEEAEKILSDSEKQCAAILMKANKQAIQITSEKNAELKELGANTINAASTQAAKEKEAVLEQSRKNIEVLRKTADKSREKALSIVIDRLSDSIGE